VYTTPPQHHLPTGTGTKQVVQNKKTQVGPASVLDHASSVAGRSPDTTVHRRAATAHIARRLLLVLVFTADTPAEDVAGVKAHGRGRHSRHFAKTLDLLEEQVEGHCLAFFNNSMSLNALAGCHIANCFVL